MFPPSGLLWFFSHTFFSGFSDAPLLFSLPTISAAELHRACMPMRVYVRPLALRTRVLIVCLFVLWFYVFFLFFCILCRHLVCYVTPPYRLNVVQSHLPPLPPATAAPCRARTCPSLTGSLFFFTCSFALSLSLSFCLFLWCDVAPHPVLVVNPARSR